MVLAFLGLCSVFSLRFRFPSLSMWVAAQTSTSQLPSAQSIEYFERRSHFDGWHTDNKNDNFLIHTFFFFKCQQLYRFVKGLTSYTPESDGIVVEILIEPFFESIVIRPSSRNKGFSKRFPLEMSLFGAFKIH